MSADDTIKAFSAKIVIVDDGFAAVRLESIQDDDWAQLRAHTTAESWKHVKEAHFPTVDRVIDLKLSNDNLAKAWDLYAANHTEFTLFDPIFARIREQRDAELIRLQSLMEYFETDLQLELCKHPSMASAVEDIKQCKLVFLDFYLYQTSTDAIIEEIGQYSELFNGFVEGVESGVRRIVVLISTSLPSSEKIELFRKASNLKGAFFKTVSKADLTKDWLRKELSGKISRYDDMQRWVGYLDTFSKQISAVSSHLRTEIDGLELHDLAILDSVRLQADSEPLGDYLSWLFSEALAARLRQSAPLVAAGGGVDKISSTPFNGMLKPKPILFDLYSEIAFAACASDSAMNRVRFGDVFSPMGKKNNEEPPVIIDNADNTDGAGEGRMAELEMLNDLLLIVAPACDLQRCADTYEVLCVRGSILETTEDLAGLLGQKPLIGKSSEDAITFRHLLRHKNEEKVAFHKVEWNPKRITTIAVADLRSSGKFKKRGQINELLGHEIKEEALRQSGRVGVPVDPSFSSPLSAALHISRKKSVPFIKKVTETECVAGIFISANEQNPAKILASEEFLAVLGKLIIEANTEPPIPEKVLAALQEVQSSSTGILLNDKGMKEWNGGFKVRLVPEYDQAAFEKDNAIIFYPVGKVAENVEAVPSSAAGQGADVTAAPLGEAAGAIVAGQDEGVEQVPPTNLPEQNRTLSNGG